MPVKKSDNIITGILVAAILLIAACLRLYHPFALQYTYDEVGSLLRTQCSSFSKLIAHNMVNDVHPVGIAVLLYYWTKLTGYTALYVKLPFIVFGILNIWYVFKIGKDWFNPAVGLVSAAYMATLQYLIMPSQEIRPYAGGLFFSAAMVYHWSRIMFKPEKRYEWNWIWYILFSALCAYTHYFALLFSAIVGFTGVFFVKKRYAVRYITAGIMIFVLYIPHLHIFFYQLLHLKGVGGWLSTPHPDFIIKYLEYVFHFSPYVYACVAVLFCWGLIYCVLHTTFPLRFWLISLIWFLLPLITGYLYSVYVNPVLQYRVLVFSFPFLLFGLFGLLPDVRPFLKVVVIGAICAANIFSLVYGRKYYQLYYQAPIARICALNDSVTRAMGKINVVRFMEGDSSGHTVENFYIKRYHYDSTFILLDDSPNQISLVNYLSSRPAKFLSYGCTSGADATYLQLFLNYYPYVVKQYNFFGGNFYILSSAPGKYKSPYIFSSCEHFDGQQAIGWNIGNNPPLDTIHFSGKYSYHIDSLHEYRPAFTYTLKDMIHIKNDIIAVSAEIFPEDSGMNDVNLVASLQSEGKTVYWSGSSLQYYIPAGETGKWIKVYHTIKLPDININYPNIEVKAYIWNKGRRNFNIDDFDVSVIKGNPYLYGIIQKLQ